MSGQPLPRQAILIVNATSRRGEEDFTQARDRLVEAGIELIDARALEDASTLDAEIKHAIERAPMVVVGGGDGTLSSAVGHFPGTGVVFALLPLGTANSFARTLGIPLDLDEAVGVIAGGVRRRIDLGEIDGDTFANTASIGLSPMIAEGVPPRLKKLLGRFGYLLWALRCTFEFQPFRLIIEEGDKVHRLWATEVRIANGGHFGGVELVETAELDSGEIVIEAVTGRSLLRLAWTWLAAVLRLSRRETERFELRGREFRIRTWPRQWVSVDGEISRRTPVIARVAKGAVEVAAPGEG